MKPMLILPPDEMSTEDMERLRDNGICVVESKRPDEIRFLQTPLDSNHDEVIEASLQLTRFVVNNPDKTHYGSSLASYWASSLMNAHPPHKQRLKQISEVEAPKKRKAGS